jgi:hypothetical protein
VDDVRAPIRSTAMVVALEVACVDALFTVG